MSREVDEIDELADEHRARCKDVRRHYMRVKYEMKSTEDNQKLMDLMKSLYGEK